MRRNHSTHQHPQPQEKLPTTPEIAQAVIEAVEERKPHLYFALAADRDPSTFSFTKSSLARLLASLDPKDEQDLSLAFQILFEEDGKALSALGTAAISLLKKDEFDASKEDNLNLVLLFMLSGKQRCEEWGGPKALLPQSVVDLWDYFIRRQEAIQAPEKPSLLRIFSSDQKVPFEARRAHFNQLLDAMKNSSEFDLSKWRSEAPKGLWYQDYYNRAQNVTDEVLNKLRQLPRFLIEQVSLEVNNLLPSDNRSDNEEEPVHVAAP